MEMETEKPTNKLYNKTWKVHGIPELKECPLPFCHGSGHYNDNPPVVFCTDCGLSLDNDFSAEYGCIELWNARTEEEIEALLAADQYHFAGDTAEIVETSAAGYSVCMGEFAEID